MFLSFLPGLEGQLVLLKLVAPVRVDLLIVRRLVGGAASVQTTHQIATGRKTSSNNIY
jgi:hypothetical protein